MHYTCLLLVTLATCLAISSCTQPVTLDEYLRESHSTDGVPITKDFWFWRQLEVPAGEDRIITVVFEKQVCKVNPGEDMHRVHTFGPDGRRLEVQEINAGWRQWADDVKSIKASPIGIPVIALQTVNGYESPSSRQLYAVYENRLVLVRIEDETGKAIRNTYRAPNWTLGEEVAEHSAQWWEEALNSSDRVRVLQALMWLGGIHLNPGTPLPEYVHEDPKLARLAQELLNRPSVKTRIAELRTSDNEWIRDAAAFAAEPRVKQE
jgi:hypothetical protein